MKTKVAIVILILLSLGLSLGLWVRHTNAVRQKESDQASIIHLSNEWTQTSTKLQKQIEISASLTNNLQAKAVELDTTAKQLADVNANLAKLDAEAKAAAKAAVEEIAKRDAKIADLENQKVELDKQAVELRGAIGGLESKIADTQKKLDASEGDREFLLKELKRLQAEKADLERKFNDLVVLREQVKKLKEELAISRRIEWIKQGLYGEPLKGGAQLQRGFGPAANTKTNYDLNVEVKRDGSATVVPATNAPPPAPK